MVDRLTPLTDEGWLIILHASTAAVSLLLGIFILVRPKGSLVHRALEQLVGQEAPLLDAIEEATDRLGGGEQVAQLELVRPHRSVEPRRAPRRG